MLHVLLAPTNVISIGIPHNAIIAEISELLFLFDHAHTQSLTRFRASDSKKSPTTTELRSRQQL